MSKNTTAIGSQAEEIACKHLEGIGYTIIARNDRTRFAELDIVARNNNYIVFVEVKYRKHFDFGGGAAAVTADKYRRLHNGASMWLAEHPKYEGLQPRIDVLVVEGEFAQPNIEHIEGIVL